MATTKVLLYFVRRSSHLPCSVQMTLMKPNFYLPLCSTKINYSDQKSITKSEQSESTGQVQVSFGEAGN